MAECRGLAADEDLVDHDQRFSSLLSASLRHFTFVLPLRFTLVASLAAVCLWGLFSLLDNLGEPELLRSPKLVVVKGCDAIETAVAAERCPQLLCQKAILEAKLVPLRAKFETALQRRADNRQVIAGVATAPSLSAQFACVLDNDKVTAARLAQPAEIESLAAQNDDWSL